MVVAGNSQSNAVETGALARPKLLVRLATILGLATVYFGAAKLGLSMAFVAAQVSAVWPPTGIALAAVVLLGEWVWPGIALGAFLANATAAEPAATAAGIAIGNTLEALVGARLLKRFVQFDPALERLSDALGLIGLASIASTMVSASIGATSLCVSGLQPWSAFPVLWWTWWLGDALGDLVMAPVLLTVVAAGWARWPWARTVEGGLLAALLFVATPTVFGGLFARVGGDQALGYIVFPFAIWAALRLGPPASAAVTLIAAIVAIWCTVHGLGPFARPAIGGSLVLLQVFMAVVAVTGLLLSAAIAEQRRAEIALHAAHRRKDEFLAMLSHELRNPLAAMSDAIQVARRSNDEADVAWARGVIENQVGHLSRLIDDLLDIARITRGKVELRRRILDLADVVPRAVDAVRPFFAARRHELAISLGTGPLLVEADPTRLEQVLVNLLTNAAKYTEPSGRIEIRTRREGDFVVLAVKDTGMGITADQIACVFELFAQGDRSAARSEGGLGVGLTLVKSLVELHGGRVTATSGGAGQGSEFTVYLPAAEGAPQPTVGRPARPGEPSTPVRVLVVDDNRATARGMTRLLQLSGYEVEALHDGREVLASVQRQRPDIVLLDIGLPDMDGYQVASQLRHEQRCRDTLIVAVSGYGQDDDRRRSREAGFDYHLVKPVDFNELLELISKPRHAMAADSLRARP
jgi:signal transduction histidine kinase/ActR/RegA family two-component response regulator